MKSIVLIGYMGAGKTTIGHAMAKEMGLQFYDLDWYIEMRFHRTVAQIFEERGEGAKVFICCQMIVFHTGLEKRISMKHTPVERYNI